MSRPVKRSVLLACAVLVVLIAQLASSAFLAAQPPEEQEIHLKSRRFSPPSGIDPGLQAKLATTNRDRVHVLIQLPGIPDVAKRQRLRAAGVQLLDYIPNNAWFASVPANPGALQRLQSEVRWFGPIEPADKIASGIQQQGVGPWARQPDGTVDLWVSFFGDVAPAQANAVAAAFGATILKQEPASHRLVLRIAESEIQALAQEDDVRWIVEVPPQPVHMNADARRSVGVNTVNNYSNGAMTGTFGTGVNVGIWDGGAVGSHEDLSGRVTLMDQMSNDNHATHVAGTIGGSGAFLADRKHMGMAPGARIFSWDWNENLEEHQEASAANVVLSSNSWGYSWRFPWCTPYGAYGWGAREYDQITRGTYPNTRPILVLFAAGNSQGDTRCSSFGNGFDTIGVPAAAKNMVTVGAINSDDSSMTTFSGWGPTDDGRVKPEVVAPGCQKTDDKGLTSTLPNNAYASYCGTSMATPATTGISALIVEQFRQTFGRDPLPSTTKAILIHTATDLGNPGPDYKHGYGLINARKAVDLVAASAGIHEEADVLPNGQWKEFVVTTSGATSLTATLVWSDFEAAENASKMLVNNLDVEVVPPSGPIRLPWVLNPASPNSPAANGVDSTNVVEQVFVNAPANGTWKIRVRGLSVPSGPQPYSLIITGASPASGGGDPTPTPTPSPTATPSPTPSPTSTPSPTTTPVPASILRVTGLSGSSQMLNKNSWRASVTVEVRDQANTLADGATVKGSWSTGGSSECLTSGGTCTISSGSIQIRNASTTFTVNDVLRQNSTYDSTNSQTSVIVNKP
jgi:subtilisin family serine protease